MLCPGEWCSIIAEYRLQAGILVVPLKFHSIALSGEQFLVGDTASGAQGHVLTATTPLL